MTTKIHYGDNIFYLESLLKTIKNGLSLEIDPEYFTERIATDILFMGSALSRIYSSLKANSYLIKKNEYLRSLLRAKRDYVDLLDYILGKKIPFASGLEHCFPKFSVSRAEQIRNIEEIKIMIETRHREEISQASDIISGEEFRILLNPAESQE